MKYLISLETVDQAGDIAPGLSTLKGVTNVAVVPAQELMRMEPDDRLECVDRMLGLSSES
jgi:hypothetical protein